MTAHHIDAIPDDLADTASYGEKLGVPREETVSMDRIGELISQRLPPSRDPMERIIRYEGHLHRQLIQTIRELEATQARRKGDRPSALTRFDVSGSS